MGNEKNLRNNRKKRISKKGFVSKGKKSKKISSKKKTEKLGLVLIFLLIFFLILFLFLFVGNILILDKKQIYTNVHVANYSGFDLNSTALTFGFVNPGQGAQRSVIIKNDFDKKAKIIIRIKGNISDFLIVSENNFFLEKNQSKEIDFSILLPKNIDFGEYTGIINIILKKF